MNADDLYGLPLKRFVPERGALAKALRGDGDREQAAEVAGLRKPSVAAWAVNQLVRTQHKATKELFATGDALRSAQEDLLAGSGDGRSLRAANERERAAVDALVDAARGLLCGDGAKPSEAVIERVADTLHAAALDEDARDQVREGRLERELRHAGLGLGEDVFATAAAAAPTARAKGDATAQASSTKRDGAGKRKPAKGTHKPDATARAAERERVARERAGAAGRAAAQGRARDRGQGSSQRRAGDARARGSRGGPRAGRRGAARGRRGARRRAA